MCGWNGPNKLTLTFDPKSVNEKFSTAPHKRPDDDIKIELKRQIASNLVSNICIDLMAALCCGPSEWDTVYIHFVQFASSSRSCLIRTFSPIVSKWKADKHHIIENTRYFHFFPGLDCSGVAVLCVPNKLCSTLLASSDECHWKWGETAKL